jgi:large subunit ribosomal protein L11
MAKKVKIVVKINLKGGEATPAPPVGTALGQHGVSLMDFVKQYNDKTASMKGEVVPAVITIYEDRSFDFVIKKAPMSELIKKKLGIEKGSGTAGRAVHATLTRIQAEEVAKEKMVDLNTENLNAAVNIVAGTARSMGIKTEGI